jgi:hypothetical protein
VPGFVTPARSTGGKTQGWSGGEGSPSERARPMGWGVGVRASRPASRAPDGAKGPKPNAPPGNDAPPSLPGPSAGSHFAGFMRRTQSWTTAPSARIVGARQADGLVGSERRDQLLGLLLVRTGRSRTHLPATNPYNRFRGTSKHLVQSRTKHAGLKQDIQTPPDTTNADAKRTYGP